jgi:hypothetical protein
VVPRWTVFALFPGIFVVHLRSVLLLRTRAKRPGLNQIVGGRPQALLAAYRALFVAVWVIAVASIAQLGGQPTVVNGEYFLNDHGDLIPVTLNGYRHALVLEQRIFTLIPSVFYALGVIVNWPPRQELLHGYPPPPHGTPSGGRRSRP